MSPTSREERARLEEYRHSSETLNRQAEKMGVERLYARSQAGLEIKVAARGVAWVFSNIPKLNHPATGLPRAWRA